MIRPKPWETEEVSPKPSKITPGDLFRMNRELHKYKGNKQKFVLYKGELILKKKPPIMWRE